jgi:hypothetical protein
MSDINEICDAFFGSIAVTADGQFERNVGPIMDPNVLDTVISFLKKSPCDVDLFRVLEILAKFKYNKNYISAFGGTPSYIGNCYDRSDENTNIANQAIDYVYSTLKYQAIN